MKKVIFFMYSFPGGGAERTVLNIINNMDKNLFKPILVLGTKDNASYLSQLTNNAKIIDLNLKRARHCILPLRKIIKEEKPDVVFSTINPNNIILSLAKLLSFKKTKVILRESNNRTKTGNVGLLNKISTYICYNFLADEIVALSDGVKQDLTSNFKVRAAKINVIYNPIEVDSIKSQIKETVKDYDFERKGKTVIAVGRLVKQKDYPTLIKAFNILKEENIRLIILGKGPLENDLKKMVKKLGLEKKIYFLGFKRNPYKYMNRSDLFVLSSKWEGFGHVIVEAMASEVPVVSTDCMSGPAEIIGDNKYGALVPVENYIALANEIKYLLSSEKVRIQYVKKGVLRAKRFSAATIVKEYEKIFYIR